MIAIHDKKLRNTIIEFAPEINVHLAGVKALLNDHINAGGWYYRINNVRTFVGFNQKEIKYLKLLKISIKHLLSCNASDLDSYKLYFDDIISKAYRDDEANNFKRFKDKLLAVLGYSTLRSDPTSALYPKFYEKLGIKACVYCNAQLTVTVDEDGGTKSAKFEVDHYYPKSEYPCFSISFFNLYPVCSSCNGKKGADEIPFRLYSSIPSEVHESGFEFSIVRASLARFKLNCIEEDLEIEFNGVNADASNAMFAIKGIYNTQKDLAAEIILKALVYNKSYQFALQNSFEKLYGKKPVLFNRIILGNYPDVKDIHKRPMAKFTQDIGKQLGLI